MPFIDAGGLRIHYRERGEGVPVVMVHGNWGTSLWWEPLLERLPEGLRGLAYDMRGRGLTEGPDNDYTMPEMATDLRIFADALGLGAFHLIGHSLGSAVTMEFMLESPERVLSMTAVAPAWVDGMPAAYNVPAGQQAIKADKALFQGALKALAPTVTDEAFWQQIVDEGFEQRIEAALKNLPALVEWQPGDTLRDVGVRSLVVSGETDPLTGGANAERATDALGATHVILAGVGHSPIIEVPDDFMAVWLDFVGNKEG